MALYKYASQAEDGANGVLTRAFDLEHSFTRTIASLAPPPQTGEKVMPGALYSLIAAMGSSIVVRNRNILLRASVPLAVGIGAGWYVIPRTMANVADLLWEYEKRVPAVADAHLRAKARAIRFYETGVAHSKMSAARLEETIGDLREKLEGWVKKGR
jgi:organizing structure protein 2